MRWLQDLGASWRLRGTSSAQMTLVGGALEKHQREAGYCLRAKHHLRRPSTTPNSDDCPYRSPVPYASLLQESIAWTARRLAPHPPLAACAVSFHHRCPQSTSQSRNLCHHPLCRETAVSLSRWSSLRLAGASCVLTATPRNTAIPATAKR